VRSKNVMKQYDLGPNGGILTSLKGEDFLIGTKAILLHHVPILHRITDINVGPEWQYHVTSGFKDKTECITICVAGSSSIHIVTSSVNNQQQYHEKRIKRL
jgi:hypothetical protein